MSDENIDPRKPSDEFLAWFAGFLEADGHVSHHEYDKGKQHVMTVTQAGDKGYNELQSMKRQFGIGSVYTTDVDKLNEEESRKDITCRKAQHNWETHHPIAISKILQWVQPYLDPHTKLSDELEYYNIKETAPVWDQNKYYKVGELESMIKVGAATHNIIKKQYFPKSVTTNKSLTIDKPLDELKVEYDNHYDGDKELDKLLEKITDNLINAIDDINIEVPHSLDTIYVKGFDSVEGQTVLKIEGDSEPSYIPQSFNSNTELDIELIWLNIVSDESKNKQTV